MSGNENEKPNGIIFVTSMGEFAVELYWMHAPICCGNLVELSKVKYFNNIEFHKVARNFIIQTGDPTGTGRGGQVSEFGNDFDNEITKDLKHTGAGIVCMASNTGTQFYITLAPTPWLDGKHAIFGRISAGLGIVDKIGLVAVDSNDKPTQKISIVETYFYTGVVPLLNTPARKALIGIP